MTRRMKINFQDAAIEVLKDSGRPMTCSEICQAALKIAPLAGKTPYYTCYSALYRSEEVKKVGKALFALAKSRLRKDNP